MTGGDVIELYLDVYRYSQTAYDVVTAPLVFVPKELRGNQGW